MGGETIDAQIDFTQEEAWQKNCTKKRIFY